MNKYRFLFFGLLILTGCSQGSKKKISTINVTFKQEGTLYITRNTDTILNKLAIELANTPYKRETGLMYRSSMEENQGMLFLFDNEAPRSFYMKNTEFPLDILYINKHLRVTDIIRNTIPYSEKALPSRSPAQYVLEINGGQSNKLGISVGDQISFYTP